MENNTSIIEFTNYKNSIKKALDDINASQILSKQKQILIKPNCVEAYKFPITTHPDSIGVIIDYIKDCSDSEIIVAEGTGAMSKDTDEVFEILGYKKLAKDKNIKLIDLNKEKLIKLENNKFQIFKEYYIPEIAFNSFIISVPVLKAHSISIVTLSLKNMMGFAPPKYYQKSGFWKKSFFHNHIHKALIEINHYRSADMIVLDASVGLAEFHLGGKECNPKVNKIIAGFDSVTIDKIGTKLLGLDWQKIPHINNYYDL
jgi:uncharacterized protein (DUF362 family)